MALLNLSLAVLVLNLPFGFWRASVKKYSPQWFFAVHGPVPLVVAARLVAGVGWGLPSLPLVALAFCGGQLLGGAVHGVYRRRARSRLGQTSRFLMTHTSSQEKTSQPPRQ